MIYNNIKYKKSVMGPVISVFVMVLVVSILAGLTFFFVSSLKTEVYDSTSVATFTVVNESGWINFTGDYLNTYQTLGFSSPSITLALNGSQVITAGNFTLSSDGFIINASAIRWNQVNFTYTYVAKNNLEAYNAVNKTEAAGATVVDYLPLIFLAVIFGALLTLVLKIILPYINLGQNLGGF